MTSESAETSPAPVSGLSNRQISLRKLMTLVGIWCFSAAWSRWLIELPRAPNEFWSVMIFILFGMLPVGLPLSLVVWRGWSIVPWLVLGLAAAFGFELYHYGKLIREHVKMPPAEMMWFSTGFSGLGAGCFGCMRLVSIGLRQRRWALFATSAVLTLISGEAFWLLSKLLQSG